ncbi:MAG: ribonuclease HII [Actinomycetota bacterium]|nr:ribonuclease HII [Actinomycetota bacterium]
MSTASPHLELERALCTEGFRWVGAIDEVGRGSVFGPCCVGVVVIDSSVTTFPAGLRDSKLLRSQSRDALIEPLREWVSDVAVAQASAREIDEFGLTAALRLAGRRALAALTLSPEVIILDGAHDWLSRAEDSLLAPPYPEVEVASVRTRIKADVTCASVAAASVFAKVHRDQLVTELARGAPGYDIESNKGYATPAHLAALRRLGPSDLHRVSWKLPQRSGPAATNEEGVR